MWDKDYRWEKISISGKRSIWDNDYQLKTRYGIKKEDF